jgi:hypothetical protein
MLVYGKGQFFLPRQDSSAWNGSGTVYARGNTKVDIQVEGGTLATAAIQAGSTTTMNVRNPWPGKQAEVVNGATGAVVVEATAAPTSQCRWSPARPSWSSSRPIHDLADYDAPMGLPPPMPARPSPPSRLIAKSITRQTRSTPNRSRYSSTN